MTGKAEALQELLQSARTERINALAELEVLEIKIREVRERAAALTIDEETLRDLHRRWFPGPDDDDHHVENGNPVVAVGGDDWAAMTRSAAVERAIMMMNASRPTVSPGDIEDFLAKAGRSDTRDEIGGVTAYLNRTGKIHSQGRGKWVYGPDPERVRHLISLGEEAIESLPRASWEATT
ncbi:hypothetical protein [uncultured Jatrophihabitans sp.]|uniref:hypothetical protein n=1 Tax=uncultured Jatrophihabitans sp. TaxID=1610747 RepID=UPI0035C943F2